MINDKIIETILEKRKNLHPNDEPGFDNVWRSLTEIFTQNEEETINYLRNCPKEHLKWIKEVFDDISEEFKSEKFIDTLEYIEEKFPDLELSVDINYAKKYLE